MTRFALHQRVTATPEAVEVIERLKAKHGAVAFLQYGERGEGTAARCVTRAEFLPREDDVKLGTVAGSPFFMDAERYDRWGEPDFEIDVAPGAAEGFSLESLEGVHFISRLPAESHQGDAAE